MEKRLLGSKERRNFMIKYIKQRKITQNVNKHKKEESPEDAYDRAMKGI